MATRPSLPYQGIARRARDVLSDERMPYDTEIDAVEENSEPVKQPDKMPDWLEQLKEWIKQ